MFSFHRISPESTEILTEISVLYLKVNETQKAFDKLLNVTDINAGCPLGLLAFGAILQVSFVVWLYAFLVICVFHLLIYVH